MNKTVEGVYIYEHCKKEFFWRFPNPFCKKFNSINWDKDILNAKNWHKNSRKEKRVKIKER